MRSLRSAEILTGVLLAVLGIALFLAALKIPGTAAQRLRPGTAPALLSLTLVLVSLLLVLSAWRRRAAEKPIAWPEPAGMARVAVTTVATAGYFLALEPLGFPAASALFAGLLCWYLGRVRWWVSVATGVAAGLLLQLGFIRLLGLGLPQGILENLFF
jgi:putative tricarboxylic transport membrane protein